MKRRYNGFNYKSPSDHRIYSIWFDMKRRCYNEKNKRWSRYGGRGIKVCDEWRDDFQAFFDWSIASGYSDNLSIDRINSDGDYSPQNCRWADIYTQANNRTNNHFITYRGETKTMMEWSREIGMSYTALRRRINSGWDIETAFERPMGRWLHDSQSR